MTDIESLFEQACAAVKRGNERRNEEAKQKPEYIIANAMLRKSAQGISSDDEQTIANAIRLFDVYRKLNKGN